MKNETITRGQGCPYLCSPLCDSAPPAPDSLYHLLAVHKLPPPVSTGVMLGHPPLALLLASSHDVHPEVRIEALWAISLEPQVFQKEKVPVVIRHLQMSLAFHCIHSQRTKDVNEKLDL